MAGLFFSRKSKNGVGTPTEPEPVSPDSQAVYEPLTPALPDDPPDAIPGIPDLYAVLGVDARASDDIIRYAYRKKAAKLLDARWRPGRAARQLAELNAAYEILGKPDRRADYDGQRARMYYYQQATRRQELLDETGTLGAGASRASRGTRPASNWLRPRAPRGLLEAIAILGVVVVALYAGYTVLGNSSAIDLGALQDAGAAWGLPVRARTVPTPSPAPVLAQPTATPRQVIVPAVAVPSPTPAPPTAAPAQTGAASVKGVARVSNPTPNRRSDLTVTLKLTRNDQPVKGVPVFLVAHYRTVEERFPAGDGTVPTDDNGEAAITFNIGDATAGFPVNVDVTATVDGEPVQVQTTFLPK
ncbi:MAG: J domain-containing protein [Chloroflexota bacterium]